MPQPSLDEFLHSSNEEIARFVHTSDLRVCTFAVNGTRRWFRLETPDEKVSVDSYLDAMVEMHIRVSRIFFEHGIETLVMPVFGPELLTRAGYEDTAWKGLHCLATDPRLLEFYAREDIRVRFYGDYCEAFQEAPWSDLLGEFDELARTTAAHKKSRLLLGACAQDSTDALVKHTLAFYQEHGRAPTRDDLTRLYYGECIDPSRIFIGFDSFYAFDMPLLDVGETALYFTVCPSPYLTTTQLREILYDYIYMRDASFMNDPMKLSHSALENMRTFYAANRKQTQGIGFIMDGIWYPTSHVIIPPGVEKQPPLPATGELRYLAPRR
ncbi:MAG: hypothetical protein WCE68_09610 [Anaerolineales bacterium]